jgi:hypothetical protein
VLLVLCVLVAVVKAPAHMLLLLHDSSLVWQHVSAAVLCAVSPLCRNVIFWMLLCLLAFYYALL